MKRQAAGRPDPRSTRVDRTGQAWLSHSVPFLVLDAPERYSEAWTHSIVWLETSGSVEAAERDLYPEFDKAPWEQLTYLERVA